MVAAPLTPACLAEGLADCDNARHSTGSEPLVFQTSTPLMNREGPPAARPLSYPALYAAHLQ